MKKIIISLVIGLFVGYFFAEWNFKHSAHYLDDRGGLRGSDGQCWIATGWDPISCEEK